MHACACVCEGVWGCVRVCIQEWNVKGSHEDKLNGREFVTTCTHWAIANLTCSSSDELLSTSTVLQLPVILSSVMSPSESFSSAFFKDVLHTVSVSLSLLSYPQSRSISPSPLSTSPLYLQHSWLVRHWSICCQVLPLETPYIAAESQQHSPIGRTRGARKSYLILRPASDDTHQLLCWGTWQS